MISWTSSPCKGKSNRNKSVKVFQSNNKSGRDRIVQPYFFEEVTSVATVYSVIGVGRTNVPLLFFNLC